jgi:hypothetical protein
MKTSLQRILSVARRDIAAVSIIAAGIALPANAQQQHLVSHEQVQIKLQALPEPELKEAYLHCSREATHRLLGNGEIALCSIVYETLLSRIFAGDFDALLAWSRQSSGHTLENASAKVGARQP